MNPETKTKYPRTYHLPFSPGRGKDDKVMSSVEHLVGLPLTISEKMDGCFPAWARISLPDGTTKKLNQLKIGDEVLGVDNDGNITSTKIINTFCNGPASKWLKIVGERRGAGRGNSFFSMRCTPNHKVWVPRLKQYIPAENLKSGDIVSLHRTEMGLTPLQEQVILGKMLGDGSIYSTKWSSHISWGHKKEDIEYVKWTIQALGCLASESKIETYHSGYGSEMKRCRTSNNAFIKQKFESFVNNDKKIVPKWVANELTPIALAFWYMDDGSLCHHDDQEDRAEFSTCSFTEEDCKVLIKGLKKYNIYSSIYWSKGYPSIRLTADNAEKLFLLIAPYISPQMQRKLPERYRGGQGWLPYYKNSYKSVLVDQKITSIEECEVKSQKYDIETETHNYFAYGVLVHNSNVCMTNKECFSRSHSGPPTHESFNGFKALHAGIKYNIPSGMLMFGEWCFAKHSISYDKLPAYFLLFGVKDTVSNMWISWTEVELWAQRLGVVTVPVVKQEIIFETAKELEQFVTYEAKKQSLCGTDREGLVVRKRLTFDDKEFSNMVGKYVRKDHVQTTTHWKFQQLVKNELIKG